MTGKVLDSKMTSSDDEIVKQLVKWGIRQDDLRVMLWTSTRTNPNAPVDLFSDYDIILVVRDIRPYYENEDWLNDFGEVLALYRDPLGIDAGCERFARITQYEDGLKIDFSVWPVELLSKVVVAPDLPDYLDVGYQILVDKDGLAEGLKPPTYRAFIPFPPDEATYKDVIGEFFHEATYVAKHLWRDDLIPAKYNLEFMMIYDLLRRMLEWQMEIDHHWGIKIGAYGKGLKKRVRPEVWAELESCFTGAKIEENWAALFRTIDLFRKVAVEVGLRLGYQYLHDLDRRVLQYLHNVENLDRKAVVFPETFPHRSQNERRNPGYSLE